MRNISCNNYGVSAVFGTILLISLTVIFGSVIVVWVNSFNYQVVFVPSCGFRIEKTETGNNITYNITLISIHTPVLPKDVYCKIYNKNLLIRANFKLPNLAIQEQYTIQLDLIKNFNVSWYESNDLSNNKISTYDYIILNFTDLSKKDKQLLATYIFDLWYKDVGSMGSIALL